MNRATRLKQLGLFISYKDGNIIVMSRKYENDINFQNKIKWN